MLQYIVTFSIIMLVATDAAMNVVPVSSVAGASTNYTFTLMKSTSDAGNIVAGSVIKIIFPSQYSLTAGSYTCTILTWSSQQPTANLVCSISGLTLTITGGFPSYYNDVSSTTQDDFIFIIQNISNPSYSCTPGSFTASINSATDGSLQLSFTGNTGGNIYISPGLLTCILTASPAIINKVATMTVSLTPTNNITSDGKITIYSVAYWTQNLLSLSNDTIFQNLNNFQCGSILNTAASITCSAAVNPDGSYTVTVSNVISATSNSAITFSVQSILAPPTTQPQGTFIIQTMTNSGNAIDQCSSAKISGIGPGYINSATISMSNTLVNSNANLTLSFSISDYLDSTDSLLITIPSQIVFSIVSITWSGNALKNYSISSNVIKLFLSQSVYVYSPSITLVISQLTNPTSTSTTSTFNISTSRNNAIMDTLQSNLTYTATEGVLAAVLTCNQLELGASSNYTFTITLSNPITNTSVITIVFPTVFSMASGSYGCVSSQASSPACTYTSYSMMITNFTTNALSASSSVVITVFSITNPLALGSFSSISITTTYSGTTDYVDKITTGLTLTIVSRSLPSSNIAVSSDSALTYTTTNLYFAIVNQNPTVSNSIVYICIPAELTATGSNCKLGSNGISCPFVTYNNTNNCAQISSIPALSAGGLSAYNISLINIKTPISTKTTSSFSIYIVYSDGTTISEYITSGITFKATNPCAFQSLSIIPNNTQDSAPTLFTLTAIPYFSIPNNSVALISFPMTASSTCTIISSALSSLTCVNSSGTVTATLQFSSSSIPNISFSITLNNYPMSQVAYTITFTLYTSDQLYQYSSGSVTNTNTVANIITINSFSFSAPILNSNSSFSVSITPKASIPAAGFILFTFPTQFSLNLFSALSNSLSYSVSNNVINVTTATGFSSTISLTFSNVTTPTFTPSNYITIETFSPLSGKFYLMDSDSSITFTTKCTLYCMTCSSTNTSSCTSCYSNSTLVSGNIYLNANNTCSNGCNSTSYKDSSINSCVACSSNCTTCSSSSTCTTCPSNYYLLNGVCLSSCPDTYYPSVAYQTCSSCSTAKFCYNCSSFTTCTSCLSTYYLYNNNCVSVCQASVTYADTFTSTCILCTTITSCQYCSGAPPNSCTSCVSGFLLYNGTCFSNCTITGYVSNSTACVPCSSPCLACTGSITTCISCNTTSANKYLFDSYCISSCPDTYYNNNVLNTCTQCTAPCQKCLNQSISSCTSCLSTSSITYYLTNSSTCVTTCPTGTYANLITCSSCNTSCVSCSSENICTQCIPSLYYLYGLCYTSCPSNMISNGTNCANCSTNCETCTSTNTQCVTCYPGFYYYIGTCISSCPTLYYINGTSCANCISPCSDCYNSTVCKNCTTGYVLDSGSCNNVCSNGQLNISGVCIVCSGNCANCSISLTNCTSCSNPYLYNQALGTCTLACSSGYYQYSSSCLSSCPDGYYSSGISCLTCNSTCATCSSSTICLSCNSSTPYFYSNQCFSSCPTTYNNGFYCLTCNISNCINCNYNSCATCSNGYLLINYLSCIASCSTGQVYNSTALACQQSNNTNNTNNTNTNTSVSVSSSIDFVPMPFLIVSVIFSSTILLSKLHHDRVSFVNAFLPILSMLNICAVLTMLVVFSMNNTQSGSILNLLLTKEYLLLFGLAVELVANILNLIFMCVYLNPDDIYIKYKNKNFIGIAILCSVSLLSSFKLVELMYSYYFSFSLFSLMFCKLDYPKRYQILLWLSLIPLVLFIVAGAIHALTFPKTSYLFFGGLEITIMSVIEIGFTLASLRMPKDYIIKNTQTQSYGMEAVNYEAESHAELDNSEHHIIQEKQVAELQNQKPVALRNNAPREDSYKYNIEEFNDDNINPSRPQSSEFEIRRAQSTQLIPDKIVQDEFEYKSTLNYPKDVMVVKKDKIAEAINQGVFRHTLKSIIQHKKKEQEESALSDANKLNDFEKKKRDLKKSIMIEEIEQKQEEEEQEYYGALEEHDEDRIIFDDQDLEANTHISQNKPQMERKNTLGSLEIKQSEKYEQAIPDIVILPNQEVHNQEVKQLKEQKMNIVYNNSMMEVVQNAQLDKKSRVTPSLLNSSREPSETHKSEKQKQQQNKEPQKPVKQFQLNRSQSQLSRSSFAKSIEVKSQKSIKEESLKQVNVIKNSHEDELQLDEITLEKPKKQQVNKHEEKKIDVTPISTKTVEILQKPMIQVHEQIDLQSIFTVEERDEQMPSMNTKTSFQYNKYIKSSPRKEEKKYLEEDELLEDLRKPSEMFNKGKNNTSSSQSSQKKATAKRK